MYRRIGNKVRTQKKNKEITEAKDEPSGEHGRKGSRKQKQEQDSTEAKDGPRTHLVKIENRIQIGKVFLIHPKSTFSRINLENRSLFIYLFN